MGGVPMAGGAAGAPEGASDPAEVVPPEPSVDQPIPFARFLVMTVASVTVKLPSQFPVVLLQETADPHRVLEIPIGMPEGVALAQAFEGVATPRPFTHQLFAQALRALRVDVAAVRIVGRQAGVYQAELDLAGGAGSGSAGSGGVGSGRERLSCRPSDGIILALRQPVRAPILVDDRLVEETGDVEPR